MAIYLTELALEHFDFPSPYSALKEPNGLLAFGGDLNPKRIYQGYQQGIFPWFGPGEPILWWSPSPRAVFDPKTFKPAKSVKKFQRKHQYTVSINHATTDVIEMCAAVRSPQETWLNEPMRQAYGQLAREGKCHSVEVWQHDTLVGGLYGIEVGQLFCGESMFSTATNASKIALWYFCNHFSTHQGKLIDCQVMNPHLKSLGAKELSRDNFMQSLLSLKEQHVTERCFQPQWLSCPVETSAEE
ncbi:leucyl/phenylalanyl-tRNA--protein transferase [Vibrio furnissii]|uniref:leucyl/phenylalanyl-tRNA--protein transferase n=1 Tax=Vibrio furnissii TaxID=29494 RepID=UPI000200D0B1|nr:leucyl/phenylalanyl-tRNA--protein transferase [Vibrio furnissii]ADT86778.1 leucyl/phenylalanyl-tRNA--protein transferase [Vibrio furnissii NCTC 11218]